MLFIMVVENIHVEGVVPGLDKDDVLKRYIAKKKKLDKENYMWISWEIEVREVKHNKKDIFYRLDLKILFLINHNFF